MKPSPNVAAWPDARVGGGRGDNPFAAFRSDRLRPRPPRLDIRNMRQLLAIQTHGSFAKAAAALGMSQPSLSTAVARLEDQLRVRLFDRTSRGSELTPIGELISQRAGRVLAETESILRDAELVAEGDAGVLRIGIGTSLKPNFLQRYVRKIAQRHPALTIHIEVLDRDALLPLLRARALDLIVCGVGEGAVDQRLAYTPVMTANAVAVSSPRHPLAAERAIPIARFAEYPAAGSRCVYYNNADILDIRDNVEDISQYVANDYEPLMALALSGVCTLIAPIHVVQPHIDSGDLVIIDLNWRLLIRFVAISTRSASHSPILQKVVAYAVELGSELQDHSHQSGLSGVLAR
jgi:DNA-binding transcriptional LysR family regulator